MTSEAFERLQERRGPRTLAMTRANGRSAVSERPDVAKRCARPGCEEEFAPRVGGRPQKYHSPECRKVAWRERERRKTESELIARVLPRVEAILREELRRVEGL